MLTKTEKRALRGRLFRHLDGVVITPTAHTLWQHQVPQNLLEEAPITLTQLAKQTGANKGYLNVALRLLCSQGWLEQTVDNTQGEVTYSLNDRSALAFALFPLYADAAELQRFAGNFHPRKFELAPFRKMMQVYEAYKTGMGLSEPASDLEAELQQQVMAHIEGILLGPTTVFLGMNGMFHNYFTQASFRPEEFHRDAENFARLLDMLTHFGYFESKGNTYRFTPKGMFFARRASAYGVTVSYQPTLRNLDELIFGDPAILRDVPAGDPEVHVDRAMNVWGSGGAHSGYFKVIDEVIKDLFNRPIEEQPKGILDMGCGNGAFLIHLFDVIATHTSRGEMLEEHPLFLVGADYNREALDISRTNLINADVWAKMAWGDIGDPDRLAADLREDYDIELGDLLNVRTFLDHNRVWSTPSSSSDADSTSTGAFVHRGEHLPNNAVEANLREHLERWKPYIERFGLLTIELHTVPPAHVAANLGRTAATAYDATHGYSDQYIVEVDVFTRVAQEIGLHSSPEVFRRYPDSEIATVSIHLLTGDS